MAKISVIIPAYNTSKTVEATINSVLNQTFGDFELIVVNDCSTDDTMELINRLADTDNRIRVYSNEKNSGVSYSRNFGVEKANSDWIAFLDSDDLWTEDKLEKQLKFIEENPDAQLTYTASGFMDNDGSLKGYVMSVPKKIDFNTLLHKNLISCSSIVVKRELMVKHKMPSDKMSEDHATWLTILKDIDYAYGLDEPLLIYRLQDKSRSSNRIIAFFRHFKTMRYVGYNSFIALFYTVKYVFYSVLKRKRIREE